jgi:3' terminal RNA ribose 2'-O-methyltransferase Hen1
MPVLDDQKHYWVGEDELEKLLRQGETWLSSHPRREEITVRYLRHRRALAREALARLTVEEEEPDPDASEAAHDDEEAVVEAPLRLNEQRLTSVVGQLKAAGARRVLDLGCGEGNLLRLLLADAQFSEIVGVDVSHSVLERASERLRLDRASDRERARITLLHSSLTYRDRRLEGYDAAALVEVIEHLDPSRLEAFASALFGAARPGCIVLTTPNAEHNATWSTLPAGHLRHRDHRFEWTRAELQAWSRDVASKFGYSVEFVSIGPDDVVLGTPTQMAVFQRA